jgi:hypothetical protein
MITFPHRAGPAAGTHRRGRRGLVCAAIEAEISLEKRLPREFLHAHRNAIFMSDKKFLSDIKKRYIKTSPVSGRPCRACNSQGGI